MKPKKQTDPMEEAYKLLDGEPAADGVSEAAKGETPQTDHEDREDFNEEKLARVSGRANGVAKDIEEAYAALFESIAVIIRAK